MSLESFQFTQSSLQDYVDCPRRFQLRYVLNQPWPAVESEPLIERERLVELGRRFHQMAQRHAVGLTIEQIATSAQDPDLARWWRNYAHVPPRDLPSTLRRAEVTLSAPLAVSVVPGGAAIGRIAAKYDLLALDPGRRAVIVDWKTERRRPTRKQLVERMQTRVYRYVLVQAGAALNGGQPIEPEQVTLIYWFAEFPAEPEVLSYDAAQHAEDAVFLGSLVHEIAGRAETVWPLTDERRRCHFCVYRSLCDRGVTAGAGDESEIEPDLEIDLTEIQEIAY
jgi:CRISPR/Cas system-associated exonuclease Cas4 (RecB family)